MNNRAVAKSEEHGLAADNLITTYHTTFNTENLLKALIEYEAAINACKNENKEPSHYIRCSVNLIKDELWHINNRQKETADYHQAVLTFLAQPQNQHVAENIGSKKRRSGEVENDPIDSSVRSTSVVKF